MYGTLRVGNLAEERLGLTPDDLARRGVRREAPRARGRDDAPADAAVPLARGCPLLGGGTIAHREDSSPRHLAGVNELEGQLVGHIVIGAEIIHDKAKEIEGFPEDLERQLKHLILSHHGELEFGSPKKPAMLEALALNLADNADAKMEMFMEFLKSKKDSKELWAGFHKTLETYIRRTEVE